MENRGLKDQTSQVKWQAEATDLEKRRAVVMVEVYDERPKFKPQSL